ncbi:IS110 family transposase [uncultured Adlercreutzia sp.]|uniref:IS110 family transposase n=1 Tax=uncultured Adlercreutzia sp. TaxID=875803 RepID=UPI00266DBC55|nr:IS110 family transposase [uncultured Adlercreutzia sp.]
MGEYTIKSDHASTIAMDQHARSVTLAGADLSTGEFKKGKLVNCPTASDVVSWAAGWATAPMRFVYESGPCGFHLAREIRALGHDCDVIAVTSIPRSADDKRLKDDRRDADGLLDAILSPGSKCRAVFLPSEESEAVRDLVRAYFDYAAATRRWKAQTSGFLLRHGHVWNERTKTGGLKGTWTQRYVAWVGSVEFSNEADNQALKCYLAATTESMARTREVESKCLEWARSARYKPYVDALTRIKGIEEMTALAFAATVDDFGRFKTGRSVSRYFGLTPCRRDSGPKVGNNGPITKAGDATCRRAVVEALANISRFTTGPKKLREGQAVSARVEAESIKCNARNIERYGNLVAAGKKANVARVAVASEVVREMWVLGRMVQEEVDGG